MEKFLKDYEKYVSIGKHSENSLYKYKSNKVLKQELGEDFNLIVELLEYVKNMISRDKKMLVTYNKSHTGTKYYYKTASGHRILSQHIKNIKIDTLIIDGHALCYKSLFFGFMKNINQIFNTKYFSFIKIDLKKFYLNIKLEHILKAIKYFVKKTYGGLTNKVSKLIDLLKKYEKVIFGTTGLYLGNYIGKLISYIIGAYIVFKQKAKVIMFFEDDLLFLYKKDKRLDLKKKFEEIVIFLSKFGFKINLNKTSIGKLYYDDMNYLGYTFGKRKRILISQDALLQRKYRFIDLIIKNLKIQDDKIMNFKFIKRKIKYGFDGFYNYYKYADNTKIIIEDICKFIRKLVRYVIWKRTSLNMFQINTYLSNKKLLFR